MYKCDYCKKLFKRENTLAVHMCEQKRRFMQQYDKDVQLAYRTYQLFYRIGTNSRKEKTYEDFAKSSYYNAFVKYAIYCIELKIDDVESYTKWLLKNQIKLDAWAKDRNFNGWLKHRLKTESVDRAIERSVIQMQEWGTQHSQEWNTYFEKCPTNLIVFHICSGKISPWIIYNSNRAQAFVDRLSKEQVSMIIEYIDPSFWQARMKRQTEDTLWVEGILKEAELL